MIKKTFIVRSVMFISSYFPLYVFLAILQFDNIFKLLSLLRNWQLNEINKGDLLLFLILLFLVGISLVSVWALFHVEQGQYCEPLEAKRPDDKVMDYVFTYIVPILSFSMDNIYIIVVNIMLFFMLWILYIKLDLIFINPLWSLFGYISYEYKNGYIITDMRYETIIRGNRKLHGAYLTNRIFLAHKKDNCG